MEEWALWDVLNVVWWWNEINTILIAGDFFFFKETEVCTIWMSLIIEFTSRRKLVFFFVFFYVPSRLDLFFTSSTFLLLRFSCTPSLPCLSFPALLLWKTWDWGCRGNQPGFDWGGGSCYGARLEDGFSRLAVRRYWFPVFTNYWARLNMSSRKRARDAAAGVCVCRVGWSYCNVHFAASMQ